jgi:hypothetical protein
MSRDRSLGFATTLFGRGSLMAGKITLHLALEVDGDRADRLVELLRDLEGIRVLEAGPATPDKEISPVLKRDMMYV